MHRTLLQQDFAFVIRQRSGHHEQYIPTIFHILITSHDFVRLCEISTRLATKECGGRVVCIQI
jgi:hypothetical protein